MEVETLHYLRKAYYHEVGYPEQLEDPLPRIKTSLVAISWEEVGHYGAWECTVHPGIRGTEPCWLLRRKWYFFHMLEPKTVDEEILGFEVGCELIKENMRKSLE